MFLNSLYIHILPPPPSNYFLFPHLDSILFETRLLLQIQSQCNHGNQMRAEKG